VGCRVTSASGHGETGITLMVAAMPNGARLGGAYPAKSHAVEIVFSGVGSP
jgi:hypothetical protein